MYYVKHAFVPCINRIGKTILDWDKYNIAKVYREHISKRGEIFSSQHLVRYTGIIIFLVLQTIQSTRVNRYQRLRVSGIQIPLNGD